MSGGWIELEKKKYEIVLHYYKITRKKSYVSRLSN